MSKNHIGILCLIILCASSLRLYGLDWGTDSQTGQFHIFHPDEQTLVDSAKHIGTDINAIVSSYGKAPMYLLAATARTLGMFFDIAPFNDNTARFTYLTARSISALLSILTVYLVFLMGRQIGNTTTGLLSALFLAFCTGHIQQSHYYTVDISLTFWITLALYISTRLSTQHLQTYIAFGIAIGLATGTRLVGVWMGIPFLFVHLVHTNNSDYISNITWTNFRSKVTWTNILIATGIGIVLLLICEPILVTNPTLFFSEDDARRLVPSMQIAQGELIRIWTLFDFSTTPYLFYFTHLLRDALGYPLEITALIGIALTIKNRSKTGILLLCWLMPYFLLVGGLHTKPIRYATPMLPALCILGAYATWQIGKWIQTQTSLRWAPALPSIIITIPTMLYALAFMNVYHQEDSRIVAARWISQNLPQNASVLTERGGFPTYGLVDPNQFRVKTDQASFIINTEGFIPYWEQVNIIQDFLSPVDWLVVIEENRARQFAGAAQQYPIGYLYYQKLHHGDLGFTIHKQFQNKPSIFGLTFHNPDSDPTVTAYDHPTVTIYHRTGNLLQALTTWRENIQQDPTYPDQALLTGIQFYREQNWSEAQKAFQKATEIRPNYLLAQIMMVNTLTQSGNQQQANTLWQRLETQNGGIPAEIGLGLSKAGLYHEGTVYLERSFVYYQKHGGMPSWLSPALAESWYMLGQTYHAQNQYTEAQEAYLQVITLLPEFDRAYLNLGEIYLLLNQPQKALPVLELAKERNPTNTNVWHLLGTAYQMQGDNTTAQSYFQQAKRLKNK